MPFVVGEAHAKLTARAEAVKRETRTKQITKKEQEAVAEAFKAELAAVGALGDDERAELERQARASLPPNISEAMIERVLPGLMAERLKHRGPQGRS